MPPLFLEGRLLPGLEGVDRRAVFLEETVVIGQPEGALFDLDAVFAVRRITSYNVCYTKLLRFSEDTGTPVWLDFAGRADFDPMIEAWLQTLSPDVAFRRQPAIFSADWALLAQAYYAAEA